MRWRYVLGDGSDAGRSGEFDDRDGAEDWLRNRWRELVDRGVDQVVLEDDDGRIVYRMDLVAE